jgi:ethanolamine ammonia-lyase small subunit
MAIGEVARVSLVNHTGEMLSEAVACLLKGKRPDLHWLMPHESLSVPSTL